MFRDGICRVNDRLYSKTVAFGDINYHLAQNEDKTGIFENYSDFLNYFDSSVSAQLSAINRNADIFALEKAVEIPVRDDESCALSIEYGDIMRSQRTKGNNGLTKQKYITYGIHADNLKAAKLRLERVEADVLNNLKTVGVTSRSLNGAERLEVLHGQFHPDGADKFRFSWNDRVKSGLSTKDYIAPTSFNFHEGKTFRIGEHYGAVSFLQILAPELSDRMLADFLDLETAVTVTIHIQSIDQSEAIKNITTYATRMSSPR